MIILLIIRIILFLTVILLRKIFNIILSKMWHPLNKYFIASIHNSLWNIEQLYSLSAKSPVGSWIQWIISRQPSIYHFMRTKESFKLTYLSSAKACRLNSSVKIKNSLSVLQFILFPFFSLIDCEKYKTEFHPQ